MTTVRPLRIVPLRRGLAAGGVVLLAVLGGVRPGEPLSAAEPPQHWLHAGNLPPGAIGNQRLRRGGPLPGYQQSVELRAPSGVSLAGAGPLGDSTHESERLLVGMEVGRLYRFRAQGVPGYESLAVYATVELVDRTYPPCGREAEFPIPVELTPEDLRLAAQGAFVTRVIYVEEPRTALPVSEKQVGGQQWFEANPGDDPLVVADELGRPVAILRIGARDSRGQAYAEPTPLARP